MLRSAIVAIALLGSLSPALAQPRSVAADLPDLQTWTLDNGLQVAFLPLASAPSVTVQVWYHAGSKDEPRDRRGSAHMFEHMMFKGTEHVRAEDHARYLSRLGGQVNAFTTEDTTAYYNTLPARHMDFAMQLEAERMRSLWFRDEMIATEKKVVQEEIRQDQNNPILMGFLRFLEIAYSVHPYAWTAGGKLKELDKTSKDDLKSFYDRYYVPNNALLVVVGNAEIDAVRASAQKWFGPIPRGEAPPRPADKAKEPERTSPRREVVAPGQIGLVLRGYAIPAANHEDIHALQVLAMILSGGQSSRLYSSLVRNQKVAVQVGGQILVREHPGLLLGFAAFLDPSKEKAVENALAAEFKRLQTGPVNAAELSKARTQLLAGFVYGLENVTGLASQIGTSWIHTGDPGAFLRDLEALQKVSAADVRRVAKTYLKDARAVTVVVPPLGGQR
jgi:zinc protease